MKGVFGKIFLSFATSKCGVFAQREHFDLRRQRQITSKLVRVNKEEKHFSAWEITSYKGHVVHEAIEARPVDSVPQVTCFSLVASGI